MLRRWLGVAAVLSALCACKTPAGKRSSHDGGRDGHTSVAPPGSAIGLATSPPASTAAPPAQVSSAQPSAVAASASAVPVPGPEKPVGDPCKVTRGPIQLPFTGAVTLVSGAPDADPRVLFNRDGFPRSVNLPAPSKKKQAERLALSETAERAALPGCAAAGEVLFCIDKSGSVHRSSPTGDGSTVVAQARVGSPVAAATIAGTHVVYAFLADRRTTEGPTTLAFAALDDGPPMVLSEDGAGATFVTLASRGEEVVAMYIDARRVLTPVHARILTGAGKLGLGADAVVFVGSGTDGRISGAIARGSHGHELALLPVDKDDHAFGLAAIRIEEQPRDDAATTWSLYPAALDRPSVAATQGVWPIRVLRVRPVGTEPRGKAMLELGEVDAAGVFKGLCPVAEGTSFADLAMLVDRAGALWIAYTDGDGTWIERRGI